MAHKAPGKHERIGLSLVEITRLFPHNEAAEQWLIGIRWSEGITCPHCGPENVQEKSKHPAMPHRCRSCRKFFSVRTRTVMQASNLDYQVWATGIYLFCTSLKSVSSMKLRRDLDITQKSAWHLAHRLHKAFAHEHKHLKRYVSEFAARYNIRELDTLTQLAFVVRSMIGKRLKCRGLIA